MSSKTTLAISKVIALIEKILCYYYFNIQNNILNDLSATNIFTNKKGRISVLNS